jgi:hypothetical protein
MEYGSVYAEEISNSASVVTVIPDTDPFDVINGNLDVPTTNTLGYIGRGYLNLIYKDPEVQNAYKQWAIEYYKWRKNAVHIREDVIIRSNKWDYYSLYIIAHIFFLLSLSAAVFEYLQAFKLRKRGIYESEEIKISYASISLKTSMHGTLLLVIAIAFYFIYIRYGATITSLS